ncbi:arylsulfatase [Microlunatus sp. GCM10028923]|uniref:sulfatase family protein n=1 Tax=Microlunatus sp. GCM10028923 TaxID=3273400 RepID=UPI00360E69F7
MTARRNVVIILADDLGWADTGCYGAAAIPTPNIDALAGRGVRFTDAHAASAVCTPSRYALLTGRYPWRSRIKHGVLGGLDAPLLDPGPPTLADAFGGLGYRTGMFGKWHLGLGWHRRPDREPIPAGAPDPGYDVDYAAGFDDGPTRRGFDRFFGISASLDMPPYCFLDQDRTVELPTEDKDVRETGQRPGLTVPGWRDDRVDLTVVDEAARWIGSAAAAGDPFLAVVATLSPHRPCVPPAEFQGATGLGRRADAVVFLDHLVGRILGALGPARDDTIVVFTSDNGAPVCYPDDGDTFRHRPNGPWRGQKADIWEAGHRVPLIIDGPGLATAESHRTVSLLDLYPTLLRTAAGTAAPTPVDGVSFAGLLGAAEPEPAERLLGMQALNGMLALRRGPGKAILGTGSGGFTELRGGADWRLDRGQFYDLDRDPGEQFNDWRRQREQAAHWYREFAAATGFTAADQP